MFYFYSDVTKPYTGGPQDFNPVKMWLIHYDNRMFLNLISERGTLVEKFQAEKELKICEKKLSYWERHWEFNMDAARLGAEKIKKVWASK